MAVTNVVGKQIIDLANDTNYYFEIAPQGDSQSRYVDVEILNNGSVYHIPSGATAILEGQNAGGYNIFNSCSISPTQDNLITIPLTNGVLSFAGIGRYSVGIYQGSSYVISFSFNIVVTEAPYDVIALQASDSYEALNQIVAKAADSNRWVVADEAPPSVAAAGTHPNDYYLDGSNGNVYYAYDNPTTGNIEWVPVENPATHKQLNIMAKTYVRYATDASGSDFSPDPVAGGIVRKYIGFLSTVNVENPLDPSLDINTPGAYTWASMSTGVDASKTWSKYLVVDTYSPTPPADTEPWSSGWPSMMVPGGYMWIKTRVTFTDNTYAEYYTVTKNGRSVDHMEKLEDEGDISNGRKTFRFVYDENDYYATTTLGTENPQDLGWYELSGTTYVLTSDTTVQLGKTYYTKGKTTNPITVHNGTAAGFGAPTIQITHASGESSATITSGGPNTAKVFNFGFDLRGSEWKAGTAITGTGTVTSTTFTENNSIVGDMYLNESTGVIYKCTGTTASSSTWVETFTVSVISNINELNNTVRVNGTVYKDAGTPPARKSAVTLTSTDSIFVAPASQDNYIYQIKIYTPVQGLYPLTAPVSIAANSFSITLTFWTKDIPATVGLPVSVEVIRKSV